MSIKHPTKADTEIVQFRLKKVAEAFGIEDQFKTMESGFPVHDEGVAITVSNPHLTGRMRNIICDAGVHNTVVTASPKSFLIVEEADYSKVTGAFVEEALEKIDALKVPTAAEQKVIDRLSRISQALGLGDFQFDPGVVGLYGRGASLVVKKDQGYELRDTLMKAGMDNAYLMDLDTNSTFLSVDARSFPQVTKRFPYRVIRIATTLPS